MPADVPRVFWLNPSTLWKARNGPLASLFGDPTGADRQRWVRAQLDRGADPDLVIRRDDPAAYSFLLMADTGEGDDPQYAVVPGLLKAGEGTRFALLSSDVLYPVGSANEYGLKFFRPYRDYQAPIYAVPGNHDWYDGLTGFMRVFCRAPELAKSPRPTALSRAWWRTLLWKSPDTPDDAALDQARLMRSDPAQAAEQPGPYWALDTGPLRIIGIDTGLLGDIDQRQGAWLRRVAQGSRPKILITGSPIYVDGEHHPARSREAAPWTTSSATPPTTSSPPSAATSTTTSTTRSTSTAAGSNTSSRAAAEPSCTPPTSSPRSPSAG